jgi:creatinine amidohydrolase
MAGKKILITNGHGGNNNLLPFFAQSQLSTPRDYIVYVYSRPVYGSDRPKLTSKTDGHAGESETSKTLVTRPTWCTWIAPRMNRGPTWPGKIFPPGSIPGSGVRQIPNHYAGEGAAGNTTLGEYDMKEWAKLIAGAIRSIKSDK